MEQFFVWIRPTEAHIIFKCPKINNVKYRYFGKEFLSRFSKLSLSGKPHNFMSMKKTTLCSIRGQRLDVNNEVSQIQQLSTNISLS